MGSLRSLLNERDADLPPDVALTEIDRIFVETALNKKGYYVMEFNGKGRRFIPRLCRYGWSRGYRIVIPKLHAGNQIIVSVYRG